MITQRTPTSPGMSRRRILTAAGTAGLLLPFRSVGGVAWAAATPATYKKWVLAKPCTDNVITPAHFRLVEEAMPLIKDGQQTGEP